MINFKLKELLDVKNVTQKELVAKTGIRQPTITAICGNKAKHLPIDVMEKICNYLECQPGDFIENIAVQNLEQRREIMSKSYYVPTTTKEERINMVNNALAISTLDAPEPSKDTMKLMDKFIEGELSEEEILKITIDKYQM